MREVLSTLIGSKVVIVFANDHAVVGSLARRHGGQGGRYVLLTGRRGRPVTVKPAEVVAAHALPTPDEEAVEPTGVKVVAA